MEDFPAGCALVLGGSGQLGAAVCRSFFRAGVPVVVGYHANRKAAEDLLAEPDAKGVVAQVNSTDRGSIKDALSLGNTQFGGIHSIVYAGGTPFEPEFFSQTDETTWRRWFETDALGAIFLAQLGLPYLRESRGAFTAISTYQCEMPEIRGAPSAISKSAVDAAVRAVAKEEGRYGVRANSVRAGWFAVAGPLRMMDDIPGLAGAKENSIPLGRLGSPGELGEAVVFLSSRRAGFITGVHLTVDGGESL